VQEDIVRAVALPASSPRPGATIWSCAVAENLFLLDGLEVPNINHFGSQGATGGPVSLLPIDLVRGAAFTSAPPSVAYGDRTSSATSITLREGNEERWAGQMNLSATGIGAIAEGPIGNGSVLFGVRRSYLDLLFRALNFSFLPTYYDATLKATQRLGTRDQLTLLALGARDDIAFLTDSADQRLDNARILGSAQRSAVAGLTWQRTLANGALTVTLGHTRTTFDSRQVDTTGTTIFAAQSREAESSLRTDLLLAPRSDLELRFGAVGRIAPALHYDVTLPGALRRDGNGVPQPLRVDSTFSARRVAAYAEATWRPREQWRVTGGLRADRYAWIGNAVYLSPRLSVARDVSSATTVTATFGRTIQPPPFIWQVGDPTNGASARGADQATLGVRSRISTTTVQVEGYFKRYRDYPIRLFRRQEVLTPSGFEDALDDIPFGLEPLRSSGRGRAWGLELLAQRRLDNLPVYGLASLTLARARFTALDGIERPGAFDVPVIVTALAGWRPTERLEVSGKVRVSSGARTTPFVTTGELAGTPNFKAYLAGPRLPTFYAIDIRVDRRWSFRATQLTLYLDIQNVTGRENPARYQWNLRERTVETDTSVGRLPSIGLTFDF
jgi:outer membrane receptor protein involved in Fe transport